MKFTSFHDLPIRNIWEDLRRRIQSKYLNLLVGAAGFEPTTCSTQNCRATRLRYTPTSLGNDVDTRLDQHHQGCLPAQLNGR